MSQTQIATQSNGRSMSPAQQKFRTLADMVSSRKSYFANVLPSHVGADRFAKVVIAALSKEPKLLGCTPESVLLSVTQAAQLGLEPTGTLGSAYLVPYGNACQLIIGYRGLIDLARRSGQIMTIEAHVVRERDRFECTFGLEPKLTHEPHWGEDPGELSFVYAIARLTGGAVQYEVMSRAQVEAIRRGSKAGKSGPWVDHFDEMARKTVVRRLCKYLPLSVELATALEHENNLDAGAVTFDPLPETEAEVIEQGTAALPEKQPSRTEAVKARVKRTAAEPEVAFADAGDPGFDPESIPV